MNKVLAVLSVIVVGIILFNLFVPNVLDQSTLKRFSSYSELQNFLKRNLETGGEYFGLLEARAFATTTVSKQAVSESTGAADYSTTNIQVAGVDEADIVKNDGKYIYTVSGNKIVIVDAFPAEEARILSTIELKGTPAEIFVNKDKLVVFGNEYSYYSGYSEIPVASSIVRSDYYPRYSSPKTFVHVYDISDRGNPVLKRNVTIDGNYFDSRMIGDYVYLIANQPVYYGGTEPIPLPEISSNNKVWAVPVTDVYYFDVPDYSYIYTNILGINTQNDNQDVTSKTFLMGYSQSMYVSPENIYITYMKRVSDFDLYDRMIDQVFSQIVPSDVKSKIDEIRNSNATAYEKMQRTGEVFQTYLESLDPERAANVTKEAQEKAVSVQREMAKETEKTVVHKISIRNGNIEYQKNGEVPGRVLNQFSMDEYNGYFRIATTTGEVSRIGEAISANHVYVLDSSLVVVGKLEDLAPGERIYSARFIGDRAYMVTFKKIDPLFVIDLKDPQNPKVLGKLKIPGYSDYLHPFDENHIIGIGKETVEAEEGDFAWYQGIKISLFDVSDVNTPKEVSKYNIGDRGTDSYALQDHKAFLFSKSKNLLVIPILLAEIDEKKYPDGVAPFTYGDFVWQGAYVLDVSLDKGFVLKGRVSHGDEEKLLKSGYYYDSPFSVKRSLYIDDVLYTVSDKLMKANSLIDLMDISRIEIS